MLNKVNLLLTRRKRSKEIGVLFNRCADFAVPAEVILHGEKIPVAFPDENGVKVAFINLLLDDCYGCRDIKKRREKIETILDIGGNVGFFGLAARNSFPDAKVHSYEPNNQLEQYLAAQAKSAGFEYFMEAVGLDDGMISLDLHDDSVQTRSKQDSDGNIPQVAFSKTIERLGGQVDLLKLDCEGAEWEIFKDTESWKKVKNLAMEYHLFEADQTESRVRSVIEGLGFEITSFKPEVGFGLLWAKRID